MTILFCGDILDIVSELGPQEYVDRRRVTPIVRSEGQRQLLELEQSTAELGRALNVSGGLVSDWRNGRKAPGSEMKQRLRNVYGILPVAWSVRAGVPMPGAVQVVQAPLEVLPAVAPPPPPTPEPVSPTPRKRRAPKRVVMPEPPASTEEPQVTLETAVVRGGTPSSLEDCLALLAVLRRDRGQVGLSPADRVRLTDAETRLLALRARLESAAELAEDRYVYQHPGWQKLKRAIVGALEPFPEAAQAVLIAIRQHDSNDHD